MTAEARIVVSVTCSECGKEFYPYGRKRTVPPPYDNLRCPNCGHYLTIYYDKELARDVARKTLKLDEDKDQKIRELELNNKELKIRLETAEGQIKNLQKDAEETKKLIDGLPSKLRTVIEEASAKIENQQKKADANKVFS